MLHYIDSHFHPEDTAEQALLRILSDLWNQHTYSVVYIAFGAKYNESRVTFRHPSEISSKSYRANYEYQMAPTFLRNKRSPNGALSIVMDDFSNETLRQSNMRLGHQIVDSIASPYHFDLVFYHRNLQDHEFRPLTSAIATFLSRHHVAPEQTMFANYIVYKHPNDLEDQQQKRIPKEIQESLNQTEYKDSFYQWFGYSFYTYYLLYRYKQYSPIHHYHAILARSFESVFEDMPVTTGTIPRMFMSHEIIDPAYRSMSRSFLCHLIDLCAHDHTNPLFQKWIQESMPKEPFEKTNLLD
jgi:hypothetical protein